MCYNYEVVSLWLTPNTADVLVTPGGIPNPQVPFLGKLAESIPANNC